MILHLEIGQKTQVRVKENPDLSQFFEVLSSSCSRGNIKSINGPTSETCESGRS